MAVGDLVGPYRLLAVIGQGAMGEVWRARDERLGRLVAVKIMTASFSEGEARRARAMREAQAAAAINHPNVVTLFDILPAGDDLALVMELVEGDSLAERLRGRAPVALDEALRILAGIAAPLVVAHDKGVLHRDIKSANVMLGPGGSVKVLDFGLAKLRDGGPLRSLPPQMPSSSGRVSRTLPAVGSGSASDETLSGALVGTPLYMAPELLEAAVPDERSEIFALGVVAHELATGRPPYAATTLEALLPEIRAGARPALDGVWPPLAALIRRALAHDPAERFGSMAELAAELDAMIQRRRRPRRTATLLALALALFALVGGGLWWRSERTAAPAASPADALVTRALEEYDLFYGDKAAASLRAALKLSPSHPRALAYLFLFEATGERKPELVAAASAGATAATGKAGVLLRAGLALATRGPAAAREEIPAADAAGDRELAFWRAELAYRARQYERAEVEYRALLADPARAFRGRIFDHHSAVLLYDGKVDEAVAIGAAYAAAFPGEADAFGVHATTLAAAGRLDEALAAAREANELNEGEDTLAGLAKVHAYRGELAAARDLYARSLQRASDARRPVRRAALALMQLELGEQDAARATVAPCLPGGAEAAVHERGPCLFVAGLVDDGAIDGAVAELERLAAAATALTPAYGFPGNLAQLLRVKQRFFAGACVLPGRADPPPSAAEARDLAARLEQGRDFYAAYHLPFFQTYALCERAALTAAAGDRPAALGLLEGALAASHGPSVLLVLAAELATEARAAAQARLRERPWPALDPASALARRRDAALR